MPTHTPIPFSRETPLAPIPAVSFSRSPACQEFAGPPSVGLTINKPSAEKPASAGTSRKSTNRIDEALIESKLGIVAGLFYALHARHMPTSAHCLRVAMAASQWGIFLRMNDDDLELLEVASLLHDVGKIGMPDRILQKPAALDQTEQSMISLHPRIGVEILRAMGADSKLQNTISRIGTWFQEMQQALMRDERETKIAQMISIVDAFDSMTTEQVYRRALVRDHALLELSKQSGTQFNPELVSRFAVSLSDSSTEHAERLRSRWLAGLGTAKTAVPSQFQRVETLNLNAAQQTLTDTFRLQMLDTMHVGIAFFDLEATVLEWNSTAEDITGHSKDTMLQIAWSTNLLSLRDANGQRISDSDCPVRKALTEQKRFHGRLEILRKDGSDVCIEAEIVPVLKPDRLIAGAALYFHDVTYQVDMEKRIESLHDQIHRDPLTGTFARSEFDRLVPDFVAEHQNLHKSGCVLLCEIDHFSEVTENSGLAATDEAIELLTTLLKQCSRANDFIARYSIHEMAVLFSGCELEQASSIGEKVRLELENRPLAALRSKNVTASFSVCQVMSDDTSDSLMRRAHESLMLAKENGGNQVRYLNPEVPSTSPSGTICNRNWFRWFGSPQSETNAPVFRGSFLTVVPLELATEKVSALMEEFGGKVIQSNGLRTAFEFDPADTSASMKVAARKVSLIATVELSEVELRGNREFVQICTVFDLNIRSKNARERRSDAFDQLARSAAWAMQSFVMAKPFTESHVQRMRVLRGATPKVHPEYLPPEDR